MRLHVFPISIRRYARALVLSLIVGCAGRAEAQLPRISSFFPIGGQVGSTVDVEIHGGDLAGADRLMAHGSGISGEVDPGSAKVDETYKPLWQSKCQSCHELRSPANRSLSAAQWAATVERMVKVRQAPLSQDEMERVTSYLVSAARAGRVTARVKIAPDVQPGLYELRVATPHGISSVGLFEVGALPEVMAVANTRELALPVTLPTVANGVLAASGERHYFKFTAAQGQRYVFDLKGYRYSDLTQMFFNPDLRLYDSTGRELVENHGYHELDPLIDWTCPQNGDYTLEVRDLLGRGNPDSVYRLQMGSIPYDVALYPPGGQAGQQVDVIGAGKDMPGGQKYCRIRLDDAPGVTTVGSAWGPAPFYITPYPVTLATSPAKITALPAAFAGRIARAGQTDTYDFQGSGRWEFHIHAQDVGSPAPIHIVLKNAHGHGIGGGIGAGNLAADLTAGQNYRLEVTSDDGTSGSDHVYLIEAQPGSAHLECVVRPPNLFVHPGSTTVAEVILTRRDGLQGDTLVSARNLPTGVTAATVPIQTDRDRAWLILKAAPDAPQSDQPIVIEATGTGRGDSITTRAVPQEEYRINNNLRYIERADCVLGVRGQPDFTASVQPTGSIRVSSQNGVEVKVHIERRKGFTGNLYARIAGLPSGWTADTVGFPGDKSDITLIVRPDGNDRRPFLKRDPAATPIVAVVQVVENEIPTVAGQLTIDKPSSGEKDDQES